MPNGEVLFTSGNRDSVTYSVFTAEIYNPSLREYLPTGTMTAYRIQSAATLLMDGSVLITGGDWNGSAETFHPAVAVSAPLLFSLSGDGRGPGVVWNAATGRIRRPVIRPLQEPF